MKLNTKILMVTSALFMGAFGVIASFLPDELLTSVGITPIGMEPLAVQLMGAVYLGFTFINWMSKGLIIGGIYARPLTMGNFLHFTVGSLSLIKGVTSHPESKFVWIAMPFYLVFALLFGYVLFTHPIDRNKP